MIGVPCNPLQIYDVTRPDMDVQLNVVGKYLVYF